MAYNRERYWFRFFRLSREQSDKLRAHYFYDGIRAFADKDFPDEFVISIPLTETLSLDPIRAFINDEKLEENNYGAFISLVTDRETAIMSVPDFIRRLLREVGGRIDFSFTVISPDEMDHPADPGAKPS